MITKGEEVGAITLLQQYTNENCARVKTDYATRSTSLEEKLKTAGIHYLFLDYMRNWTSKEGCRFLYLVVSYTVLG